jgi:hypothetical protein
MPVGVSVYRVNRKPVHRRGRGAPRRALATVAGKRLGAECPMLTAMAGGNA